MMDEADDEGGGTWNTVGRGGHSRPPRGGVRTPGHTGRGTPLLHSFASKVQGGVRTFGPQGQRTPLLTGRRPTAVAQAPRDQASLETGTGARTSGHGRGTPQSLKERTVVVDLPRERSYTQQEVAEALLRVVDGDDLEALGTVRYNNQWHITLKSRDSAAKLLEVTSLKVGSVTGRISSLSSTHHRLRVHWAPYYLEQEAVVEGITKELPEGAAVIANGFEYSTVKGLEKVKTLVRWVIVKFDGPSEHLPHLVEMEVEQEKIRLLCIAKNRAPLCLKCNNIGHKSFNCTQRFQEGQEEKMEEGEKDVEGKEESVSKTEASGDILAGESQVEKEVLQVLTDTQAAIVPPGQKSWADAETWEREETEEPVQMESGWCGEEVEEPGNGNGDTTQESSTEGEESSEGEEYLSVSDGGSCITNSKRKKHKSRKKKAKIDN